MLTKAVVFILFLLSVSRCGTSWQSYDAIYNLGDSISDTGNLCTGGCPSWLTMGQLPYGSSYFGRPTGRCSDGRVVVDFLGISVRSFCSTSSCAPPCISLEIQASACLVGHGCGLISAPIVQPPDWNLPFEIMCDASDYVVRIHSPKPRLRA